MFLYFILLLFVSVDFSQSACPTVSTVDNFNITEYTRDRWYIQKQQITEYLPLRNNYCVNAMYKVSNKTVPFYHGIVLDVFNNANTDGVNGTRVNQNNFSLCGRIPNENVSSKLLVAPCFLPNFFAGDYWVIDAGPSSSNYEYAIISGGQPTIEYSDGCTTSTNYTNNSGFWFFTREKIASDNLIRYMENRAKEKGFTLRLLNNVTQFGCNY